VVIPYLLSSRVLSYVAGAILESFKSVLKSESSCSAIDTVNGVGCFNAFAGIVLNSLDIME